jgi:hypothetical protein
MPLGQLYTGKGNLIKHASEFKEISGLHRQTFEGETMTQQHSTAWMVETAYRYLKAAQHMQRGFDMVDVAQINAAIGIEIILKSFCSKPSGNLGQINETYELDNAALKTAHGHLQNLNKVPSDRKNPDKHDLLTLFHSVPAQIRQQLRIDQYEGVIETYRHIFTGARYPYERNAQKMVDDVLIEVLDELVTRVNAWYGDLGWQNTYLYYDGAHPELADWESAGEIELSYGDLSKGY